MERSDNLTVVVDGVEVTVTPAMLADLLKGKAQSSRLPESYYVEKYGLVGEPGGPGSQSGLGFLVAGSLRYDPSKRKQVMDIICTATEGETWDPVAKEWTPSGDRCDRTRTVATSDLHQSQCCVGHGVLRQRTKAKGNAALKKALLEAYEARQAAPADDTPSVDSEG